MHARSAATRGGRAVAAALIAGLAACGSAPSTTLDGGPVIVVEDDAGPPSPPEATGIFPPHARALPFAIEREPAGDPIPAAEVELATDRYLDLMARTRWLELVDERAHGWPESDPEGRYWYATWWSGVRIVRAGGAVTYVHSDDGADNNGLRTAQLAEGACYAWRLWRDPADRHLARRLIRGMSSWHLAMRRSADDPERGLASRAAYPPDVVDTGRAISIDYSASRPGIDADPSDYIHVPANPYWPDLWVKNTRSKDDIGHMLRAVALLDTCAGDLEDPDAEADLVEMRRLHQEWAQRVERDGYRIATYDADLELFFPPGDLATYYTTAGVECAAGYAIPLLSRFDPLGYRCRSPGLGPVVDPTTGIPSGAMQILRSHHEAATGLALVTGQDELARELLVGLATRIEGILDAYESGAMPANANPSDVFQLVVESALLGLPLTAREAAFVHARIELAAGSYLATGPEWRVHDPATPDGEYGFDLGGDGIDFKDLGLLLGLCTAQWVDPAAQPVLDCARVRAARP
jgi:hypothetical protein